MGASCWASGTARNSRFTRSSAEAVVGFFLMLTPAVGVVLARHEGARLHAVNVEPAIQVIDFMLQDAGVPALGFDELWLAALIEAVHADTAEARHLGGVTFHAQAAFEELELRIVGNFQSWIDEDVKGNGAAGARL